MVVSQIRIFGIAAALLFATACAPAAQAPDEPVPPGSVSVELSTEAVAVLEAAEARFRPVPGGFSAPNRGAHLRVTAKASGLTLRPRHPDGRIQAGMSLQRWGRPDVLVAAEPVPPVLGACRRDGRVIERSGVHAGCGPDVEQRHSGLTAWFGNRARSLRFGFDLSSPPAGDGPVLVELELTGVRARTDGDGGLLLAQDGSDLLRVRGLAAFDSLGRSLPASFDPADSAGFRILVDDSAAVYPITIDPDITPTSVWQAASTIEGGSMGFRVAGVGDINGDGLDDVAVGVPGWDGGQFSEGAVFLYYGTGDDSALSGAPDWAWESDQAFAQAGNSVAAAGRVNDDAFFDLLVGAPEYDNGENNEGAVFLFIGGAGGPAAAPDWSAEGDQAEASFGTAIAGNLDVNFDGFADIAVGAPHWDVDPLTADTDEGAVLLYLGGAAGPSAVADWQLIGTEPGGNVGAALAAAGDINDDDFDDLLVGAPLLDGGITPPPGCPPPQPPQPPPPPLDAGGVMLFHGLATGLEAVPAWTELGDISYGRFGAAVSAAGDVNGDGNPDLLIGAPEYSETACEEGAAFVYYSDGSGVSADWDWKAVSNQEGALFGFAVSSGNHNGDSTDDVVVAAPWSDDALPRVGAVYVYPSEVFLGLGIDRRELREGNFDEHFGFSVANAGDLNADGLDDLLIGGVGYSNQELGEGAAYVYLGVDGFTDRDGDGFCEGAGPCTGGIPGGDCNDLEARDFPGAAERCDGEDNDCDGTVPPNEQDADGDGVSPCEGDCNDGDNTISPNVREQCDPIDHDCDGRIDNNVVPPTYWADEDGDGFGNPISVPVSTCSGLPPGMVDNNGDCDDDDADINPDAAEVICSSVDEDCSIFTPDVPDNDGDAFTPCEDCQDVNTVLQCGDCDDNDRAINPFMSERCEDGVDQNCDGEDPVCPENDCDAPDNVCEDGPDCSLGPAARPSAVLVLLPLAASLSRRRRA